MRWVAWILSLMLPLLLFVACGLDTAMEQVANDQDDQDPDLVSQDDTLAMSGPASLGHDWTDAELATLVSLSIDSLPPLPPDPTNAYAEDLEAASLGQRIFFDRRFSSNGEVACATCHQPEKHFTDDLSLSQGVGTTNRHSMTIVGTAYSPWLFWDGRKDSQWAQALGPLESVVEHGGSRTQYAHLIDEHYREDYEAVFGPLPDFSDLERFPDAAGPIPDNPTALANWEGMSAADRELVTMVYVKIGKAIAAYERLLQFGPSRFDEYVAATRKGDRTGMAALFSDEEVAGLRLFISEDGARCIRCHNGPLFTNNSFHNTGVPESTVLPPDTGRAEGVQQVIADEFNCVSPHSDAEAGQCAELRFVVVDGAELMRAFRPPTLRNVTLTAPYMHAGQYSTLSAVINHYNLAPAAPAGDSELEPLGLTDSELAQLLAFLATLESSLVTDEQWLEDPYVPAAGIVNDY
jgi:cytochrome c peroxidase